MSKSIVYIVCLLMCGSVFAQQTENIHLNSLINDEFQAIADTTEMMHTSVKPYLKREFKQKNLHLGHQVKTKPYLNVLPVLNLSSGFDITSGKYVGIEGAGADVYFEPHEKLGVNVQYNYQQIGGLPYIDHSLDSLHAIDGFGEAFKRGNRYFSNQLKGYLSYSPNHVFNLQAGVGQHFWGDGYRSILLSDNASPMPYFRISTDIWRVKYINLYAMQTDIRRLYKFNKKYTATHYLDWSINKRMNLSLFETVVWLQQDTLINRGVELNYLNPIIFYRPVEYAQGSADNVLMGMAYKFKATKKLTFYSQFLIDEFKIDELRAANGWWANKYAGQLGVKWYDVARINGLFAQLEFNGARPFTYTHSNFRGSKVPITTIQNYGHANQPLAHPLGADFWEYLAIIKYKKEKFVVQNKTNVSFFGSDSTGVGNTYGGDLFVSYDKRAKNYNNTMIQGVRNELIQNELSFSYNINPKYNLWASISFLQRWYKNDFYKEQTNYIALSLRSTLFNRYYDY